IAALSTRIRPAVVVGAAGLSFGGWTALEIWFGQAIKGALPPASLDLIAGSLFLVFGLLLLRSIPDRPATGPTALPDGEPAETDGGLSAVADGLDLPGGRLAGPTGFGTFVSVFVLMATGEFGDKTQLITISLAIEYGAHPGIWAGEMLAIIPVSLANAYFFHRFAHRVNLRRVHVLSAGLFFFFAFDTFLALGTGVSVWETIVDTVGDLISGVVVGPLAGAGR
ncbi:MAG: putative membrane protein, partial [halophilic archaeon J07HX5]